MRDVVKYVLLFIIIAVTLFCVYFWFGAIRVSCMEYLRVCPDGENARSPQFSCEQVCTQQEYDAIEQEMVMQKIVLPIAGSIIIAATITFGIWMYLRER